MSLIARNTGGGDYELTPAANHLGLCYLLVGLGHQQTNFGVKEQVLIGWELSEKMEDGRPFVISQTYTLSTNEKANLRKDLESWRGKPFTDSEVEAFNLANILGVPAMINVVHNKSGEKTYANVSTVASVPSGMSSPSPVNEQVCYDIDNHDDIAFQKLPEWIQKKVRGAVKVDQGNAEHNELNPPPSTEAPRF